MRIIRDDGGDYTALFDASQKNGHEDGATRARTLNGHQARIGHIDFPAIGEGDLGRWRATRVRKRSGLTR